MSGITNPQHDCITLGEWLATRRPAERQPLTIDSRSLEERREARWSNPDYSGKVSDHAAV